MQMTLKCTYSYRPVCFLSTSIEQINNLMCPFILQLNTEKTEII